MAVTRPDTVSASQWRQIRAMRFGIWFLTIQAAVAGAGSAVYIVSVMTADRRRRVRMSAPLPRTNMPARALVR